MALNPALIEEENQQTSDELSLGELKNIIWRKRWLMITFTLIAAALSSIYAFRLPDVYTASTKILVEKFDQKAVRYQEVISAENERGDTHYRTKEILLRTTELIRKTADQTNLFARLKERNPDLLTLQDAAEILKNKISTRLLRDTQIIELSISDTDPALAATLANTHAELFIKESARQKMLASGQLLQLLPDADGIKGQVQDRLNDLDEGQLMESLPSVVNDPVIRKLREEKTQIDSEIRQLSSRYTEHHPTMKELLNRQDFITKELKLQSEKVFAGVKAGLAGQFNVDEVRIIERAALPQHPTGPKRELMIVVATGGAFVLSFLLAVLLVRMNQNVGSEEDIRSLGLPYLGCLHQYDKLKRALEREVWEGKKSQSKELVRFKDEVANIRTAILFSMPAKKSKKIMFTSTIPGEGKSTLAGFLAMGLADTGDRVLLVDGDVRRPRGHEIFGVKNEVGLTDILIGQKTMDEVVQPAVNHANLHILTAGNPSPNPSVLFQSDAVPKLLMEMDQKFDRIIIDAPPSLHISDGLTLSEHVDGVVLVMGAGKVHRDAIQKLMIRVKMARGFMVGAVLNGARHHEMGAGYMKYYQKYHKYYGKHQNQPVKN